MNTILITYSLHIDTTQEAYDALSQNIQAIGTHWHSFDSTWIVRSAMSCSGVQAFLEPLVSDKDQLLVVALTGAAAWMGLNKTEYDWVRTNLI